MATPALGSLMAKTCWLGRAAVFRNAITKNGSVVASARGMASGGARKMNISASRFGWTRFKDDLHFYVMLGVVPLGSVILYSNLIIGQAELAEIPEGYEPKHWEYHKHPIHRWFARYVYDDPVKLYEMEVCKFVEQFESARFKAKQARVKEIMARDDDYRSWYFVPAVDPRAQENLIRTDEKFKEEEMGTN